MLYSTTYARLAQLVEHSLDVGRVTGSSPVSRTKDRSLTMHGSNSMVFLTLGEKKSMDLIAHSKQEAVEKARIASLYRNGADSGFPVYVIPWGTYSSEQLDKFLCRTEEDVGRIWDYWVNGSCHPHFKKMHVIRCHEVSVQKDK